MNFQEAIVKLRQGIPPGLWFDISQAAYGDADCLEDLGRIQIQRRYLTGAENHVESFQISGPDFGPAVGAALDYVANWKVQQQDGKERVAREATRL